jgi:hypothetical protein
MNRKLPRKISMDECSLTKCRYFNNIWSGLRYLLYYTVIIVHRLQGNRNKSFLFFYNPMMSSTEGQNYFTGGPLATVILRFFVTGEIICILLTIRSGPGAADSFLHTKEIQSPSNHFITGLPCLKCFYICRNSSCPCDKFLLLYYFYRLLHLLPNPETCFLLSTR